MKIACLHTAQSVRLSHAVRPDLLAAAEAGG
jgi:hypothetical protein